MPSLRAPRNALMSVTLSAPSKAQECSVCALSPPARGCTEDGLMMLKSHAVVPLARGCTAPSSRTWSETSTATAMTAHAFLGNISGFEGLSFHTQLAARVARQATGLQHTIELIGLMHEQQEAKPGSLLDHLGTVEKSLSKVNPDAGYLVVQEGILMLDQAYRARPRPLTDERPLFLDSRHPSHRSGGAGYTRHTPGSQVPTLSCDTSRLHPATPRPQPTCRLYPATRRDFIPRHPARNPRADFILRHVATSSRDTPPATHVPTSSCDT